MFNLVYHLKQSRNEVMSWPISERRDMWKRMIAQYDFESAEAEKR
ncbi:MAG: hypothetical protein AB1646_25275 [Thermodesulfobacteriota bacterium]